MLGPRSVRRRGPRELAHAVERLQAGVAPPTLLAAVQQGWRVAAGARVVDEAEPVSERDGIVTVVCKSAVWASELTMLSGALVERLNAGLEARRQVRALRFTTRPGK